MIISFNKKNPVIIPSTKVIAEQTKMHSSRMRSARLLTISHSMQWGLGVGGGSAQPPLDAEPILDADPPPRSSEL